MSYFNIIAQTTENTVVTEYEPVKTRSGNYQSEAALEKEFIRMLTEQGYEYLTIHKEDDLINNLCSQLEKLNNYNFSETEWDRFFKECIANQNEGIVEKTRKIQEDNIQVLKRDDGSTKNITLIDKKNIHNNFLQVVNQVTAGEKNQNRYDVTILVNGLPLVHIELKKRGVNLHEAFNQIHRYSKESFNLDHSLYKFVQIFVISNGTYTRYFANTTARNKNNYEFTCEWADAKNKVIRDLEDFTKTFFEKRVILEVLTKYCVFDASNTLLIMRPYQIAATERLIWKIKSSYHAKRWLVQRLVATSGTQQVRGRHLPVSRLPSLQPKLISLIRCSLLLTVRTWIIRLCWSIDASPPTV